MNQLNDEQLNAHRAEMFDAIREFFRELTTLVKVGRDAMAAQLEADKTKARR